MTPATTTAQQIDAALRAKLPPELYPQLHELSEELAKVAARERTPEEASTSLNRPEFAAAFRSMEGTQPIEAGGVKLEFGGDKISIGNIRDSKAVAAGAGALAQINVAAAVCSLKATLGSFDFVSGPRAGQIAEHRMFNKPGCPGATIRPDFYLPRFRQAWAQRVGADLGPISADSPVFAPPQATTAQALAYIERRPYAEYTRGDMADVILPTYWKVCTEVGLDPLLAIAQLIHETDNLCSWWAARPRRNPAGLGVTGRSSPSKPLQSAWVERDGTWQEGLCFASWQDGAIPAHIGRLLAYALSDEQANAAQRALIGRALVLRPLPAQNRGVAPTLRGLNGHWAVPGTTYAQEIARIANAIVAC
jgi:hypothetical protein